MLNRLMALPPRRRRQGLALAAAASLYSALGFLALPPLATSLASDYVRDTLHLDLRLKRLEVNPWQLAVRVDGLEIREPGGESLLEARSLYLNVDGFSSLWQRRLEVDDLEVLKPRVNARVDARGQLNLLKLVPPEDPEDKGDTPWMLAVLSVRDGRIEFRDDSRKRPFRTVLEPLTLALHNLSSRTDGQGNYRFAAETGHGERLEWQGRVALNPVRSEGRLALSGWKAETLADYAQDSLPLGLGAGRLDLSGNYRLLLESETPQFRLTDGRLTIHGLEAVTRAGNPLNVSLGAVELRQMAFDWPEARLSVPVLSARDMRLSDRTGQMAGFSSLELSRVLWDPVADQAGLGSLRLEGLRMLDGDSPLLEISTLGVEALAASPRAQVLDTGLIHIGAGRTEVIRLTGGDLNWQGYLARLQQRLQPAAAPSAAPVVAAKPWQVHLGEFRLQDFQVAAVDRAVMKPVSLPLYIKTLSIHPELDLSKPHRFEGEMTLGKAAALSLSGHLDEQPLHLDTRFRLQGLELPPMAPYLSDYARFRLDSGRLSMDGRLNVKQDKSLAVRYEGGVSVADFAASDQFLQERFLAWKDLRLSGMALNLSPLSARVKEVEAVAPFTRLMILPDKTLNLSQILAATPSPTVRAAPAQGKDRTSASGVPFEIGRVRVRDGAMLFADLSLKPQFATGIEALSGEVTSVSNRPGALAEVRLEGRVDQYGKAHIEGRLNPMTPDLRTDMGLRFENVELTTLTPYSAKFAGYRIDKGKLSLDLHYRIEDRQLQATNKVVLNQLTLGEKVDSPDAVSLPLRLALALLKDSNGVIDIDLPVSGSLDDPKFKVGPIVWQAFVNVVTKVATAPFRFIAGLVGGGEDMDSLGFAPGQVLLTAESRGKLLKLADALQKRPELKLDVRGVFDPVADAAELRTRRLGEALQPKMAQTGNEATALEALYLERFGAEALRQQKALALRPAGGPELKPASAALSASLRTALLEKEEVQEGDLRQLALDRSRAMRSLLVEEGKVPEGRVFVLEPELASATGGLVVSKVMLNAL